MKNVQLYLTIALLALLSVGIPNQAYAADNNLELYTPYTSVSVTPGSTVNYSIDVINNGNVTENKSIVMSGIPRSWNYTLTAGGLNISKLAVLANEKKTVKLKVEVPYQVKKGYYTFYAKSGNTSLPLTIQVSTAGTNESEFVCDQKNMEGTPKSNFNFTAVLKNKTPNTQQYALMAYPPRGWTVAIKPNHKQATSTEVDADGSKNISYEIKAPESTKAGTYKIPVKAVSGSTSAQMELEVVITGTYNLALSTPSGLLSTKLTAGSEKKVELQIRNTGSSKLEKVELSAATPKDWNVSFDNKEIKDLEPGASYKAIATIKAGKKSIPGDYITKITVKTPEVSDTVSFRVMVKTPMLMGWLGVVIILIAIAAIVYLMKKYGRR